MGYAQSKSWSRYTAFALLHSRKLKPIADSFPCNSVWQSSWTNSILTSINYVNSQLQPSPWCWSNPSSSSCCGTETHNWIYHNYISKSSSSSSPPPSSFLIPVYSSRSVLIWTHSGKEDQQETDRPPQNGQNGLQRKCARVWKGRQVRIIRNESHGFGEWS